MYVTGVTKSNPQTIQGTKAHPRFGWDAQHLPDFELKLSQRDFLDFDKLVPSPEFIKALGDRIANPDLANARFALITNTLPLLGKQERVLAFHKNIMAPLMKLLDEHYPEFADTATRCKVAYPDTYNSMLQMKARRGATCFFEPCHRDGSKIAIRSITYGPFENVKDAYPQIIDSKQFLMDRQYPDYRKMEQDYPDLPSVSSDYVDNVIERAIEPAPKDGTVYSIAEMQATKQNLSPYLITLNQADYQNDMPILFLNNFPSGIWHAASDGLPENPDQESLRPLHRISIYMRLKPEVNYLLAELRWNFSHRTW
jgi:hypothetical protein